MLTTLKHHGTIKRLFLIIISSIIILSNSIAVIAATESTLLFTLSEARNMSITVIYDSEIPLIEFISPSGEKLKEGAVTEDKMKVIHAEGAINYLIPNAVRGDWYIEYDKLTNKELEVNYAPYADSISIESFKILSTNTSENTADVEFEVSFTNNSVYQYIVYAVTTDKDSLASGQKELKKGSAIAGSLVTEQINLSSLSSYDSYRLMLEVYLDSSGIEVFDTAITSETFSYTNNNAPEKISDFFVEIDLSEESLLIDWTEYSVRCDEYIAAVYTPNDLNEPMFSNTFEPGITSTSIIIDPSVEYLRVELSYRLRGVTSQLLRKDIRLDNGITVAFVTPSQTNSSQAVIEYNTDKNIKAVVTVNGATDDVQLSGSGQFSVTLSDFTNDVSISYSPESNVRFIVRRDIYSDRIAPILLLYENKTTITTTEPSYTLAGETEPGCVLTVNQQAVTLKEDGTFLHKLALSKGNNEFTITATDTAGNSSMQKINIRMGDSSAGTTTDIDKTFFMRYLPLIIAFILSIGIVACILLLSRSYAKQAPHGRPRAILTVVRNILVIISALGLEVLAYLLYKRQTASKAINTTEYAKLVEKSVQDAYQAILVFERYNTLFVTACYLFGAILLGAILLSLLLYVIKRSKENNSKEGV